MSDKLSTDELEGLRVSEAIRRGVLAERDELRAENGRLKGAIDIALKFLTEQPSTGGSVADIDGGAWDAAETLRSALGHPKSASSD